MKKVTHKRINITLPESTVTLLETVADKGGRSTFIDTAIRQHIHEIQKHDLREQIKAGAIANAERDLEMAQEWFHIEEELWQD
jgi:CopG family transcriptional regulator/antitoxin EndoAI